MAGERRLRILRLLGELGEHAPTTKRLCEVCAEATEMTGAGIMLMSGDVPRGSVCTTNNVSAALGELRYALGEGPCVDAHQQGGPVLEPDLATLEILGGWRSVGVPEYPPRSYSHTIRSRHPADGRAAQGWPDGRLHA